MSGNPLFSNITFHDFADSEKMRILEALMKISDDNLLLPDRTELVQALVGQHKLEKIEIETDPLKFDKSANEAVFNGYNNTYSRIITAPGLSVTWKVPIYGDVRLFYVRPTNYLISNFEVAIQNNYLMLSITTNLDYLEADPAKIERHFLKIIEDVKKNIENLNKDIEPFNRHLAKFITDAINGREKKVNVIKRVFEAMNIPLKKDDAAPSIVPITRKLIRPTLPTAKKEKIASISNEDYVHILGVIKHVGASFERTRRTYHIHGEEALRDIMLSHLNGHYMGLATGETFRGSGKTDINIEFENRAAFVGECKVWKGKDTFDVAIQQMLSYNTWRDSKNAIILFNKHNKDFKSIQNQIPELIKQTEGFRRSNPANDGEWEFVLTPIGTDDEKTIHIFMFDIFHEDKPKKDKK